MEFTVRSPYFKFQVSKWIWSKIRFFHFTQNQVEQNECVFEIQRIVIYLPSSIRRLIKNLKFFITLITYTSTHSCGIRKIFSKLNSPKKSENKKIKKTSFLHIFQFTLHYYYHKICMERKQCIVLAKQRKTFTLGEFKIFIIRIVFEQRIAGKKKTHESTKIRSELFILNCDVQSGFYIACII